jgi:putative membrane protein
MTALAGAGGIMVLKSLAGLPAFLVYFCVTAIVAIAYLLIYTRITRHDEFALIRANVPGAAVALGLSLIGFALPVASAIAHASDIVDCAIWSVIALIVQLIAYFVARIPVPDLSQRIAAGELAAAIWLGLASVAAGLLSAASMSY